VTVAGSSLRRTAGSVHAVSSRELERFESDDVHTVLSRVPGVYTRGEDGFGLRPNISIRGVNPDRSKKVTLMEDGVLIAPAPYTAPAAYYFPLITRTYQLRVIKGPGAVGYGPQTVGGAIDLITRPIPAMPSGRLDVAVGPYGYDKVHAFFGASDSAGQFGFLIEGVRLSTSGFKELPNDADTGFLRNEVMFKGSYVPDPQAAVPNEFRLKLTYSDEVSNETYLGLSDADFSDDPLRRYSASSLDRMVNHRVSAVLSHSIEPTRELRVTTDIYHHDFERSWRKANSFRGASFFDVLSGPDSVQSDIYRSLLRGESSSANPSEAVLIGPNQRGFISQGIETRAHWSLGTGAVTQKLEFGARFHHDEVERRHSEDAFLLVEGELFPEGSATTVTALNSAWSYAGALHVADAVSWKALTVTPGARIEAIRSGSDDRLANSSSTRWAVALVPGIGAYYALSEELGVLGGVYRGFSPPAPGSPEAQEPELSLNYESGVRYHARGWRAEAIGFYNDYSNLTDVCTLSSGCTNEAIDQQFDAGRARIYGLEAYLNADLPLSGSLSLPIVVAYTLTRAEFLSTFTSDDPIYGEVESRDHMPYVPLHQLTLSPGLEHELAGANASVRYVSAMREVAGSGSLSDTLATDRQLTLDASAYGQPLRFMRVYVTAQNILDSAQIVSRRPYGARPNAPRSIQVGVKLEL
jgi:Fe(3+) dicitrate transport protein